MDGSQRYIGSPNGIVLCIDRAGGGFLSGRFYHRYRERETAFANTEQMLFRFEEFFDSINYPYPGTTERTFQEKVQGKEGRQERTEKMNDEQLLKQHGELGTFVVRVQHRQNSSWQGRITWMDQNKTVYFRSALEMMKLVADALDSVSNSEDSCEEPSW